MTADLWTISTPGARIIAALENGQLIRNAWRKTAADGRELACALAWASREVYDVKSPNACPATLLPLWVAHLVPWLDDAGTWAAWPGHMRRLGELIDRSAALWADPAATRRFQAVVLIVCVEEARAHCPSDELAILAAIDGVLALLRRAGAGDEPTPKEWSAMQVAAKAAAAESVSEPFAAAAADAAYWAAWAAACADGNVKYNIATAAAASSSDRIIDGVLTAWERAVEAVGA